MTPERHLIKEGLYGVSGYFYFKDFLLILIWHQYLVELTRHDILSFIGITFTAHKLYTLTENSITIWLCKVQKIDYNLIVTNTIKIDRQASHCLKF